MRYCELHHHSTFSYLDGWGTPAQHVSRAVELGMTSIALTEHGNVSSHVQLEKAALKAGIKPIFGLEAYTAPTVDSDRKCHLTILASDAEGYRSLMQLVNRSWAEGFHRYPTVTGQMLADHPEGLIVLSGCSDSLLACTLLGGKMIPEERASVDAAAKLASNFKDLYGDRFYLECQMFPELPRSIEINTMYEKLGRALGIPLVATGDVHTLRPGDSEIRALLHAAGRGDNTIAQQLSSWEYSVPDYLPLSDADVFQRAQDAGLSEHAAREACRNSGIIAERCNVTLPKAERFRYNGTTEDLRWSTGRSTDSAASAEPGRATPVSKQ
jgi:DNA polymerase III subunit alpha